MRIDGRGSAGGARPTFTGVVGTEDLLHLRRSRRRIKTVRIAGRDRNIDLRHVRGKAVGYFLPVLPPSVDLNSPPMRAAL